MGSKSKIEWTDATWNPARGCTKISEGCRNCYAETFAERWRGIPGHPFEQGFDLKLVPEKLLEPLKWAKHRKIFVNSMSDLFHKDIPDEYLYKVFAVMALTYDITKGAGPGRPVAEYAPRHIYQVLTKRPERMLRFMTELKAAMENDGFISFSKHPFAQASREMSQQVGHPIWPNAPLSTGKWILDGFPGLWLGVSVENQQAADERIPLLLQTPAAVRFLSCEPLLGPVDLTSLPSASGIGRYLDALSAATTGADIPYSIDWVIAGGESGHHARPMHPDWARQLRDQCQSSKVPFFFKQWGEWAPGECANDGGPSRTERVASYFADEWDYYSLTPTQSFETHADDQPDVFRFGKEKAGRHLDGQTWDEFPEVSHG